MPIASNTLPSTVADTTVKLKMMSSLQKLSLQIVMNVSMTWQRNKRANGSNKTAPITINMIAVVIVIPFYG
jgi:hypothetical protein